VQRVRALQADADVTTGIGCMWSLLTCQTRPRPLTPRPLSQRPPTVSTICSSKEARRCQRLHAVFTAPNDDECLAQGMPSSITMTATIRCS
jgi:hypothetical protein